MLYGYVRVSTGVQTTENQKLVIQEYCKTRNMGNRIEWVSETISGTKSPDKRKLGNLLHNVSSGDVIVVTELSRLGRNLMMIFNVLQELLDKHISVIAIKENYELGDNIQSKVLAFAFGLSAEIERNLISERTKAGLARTKASGTRLGRRKGELLYNVKLRPYEKDIKKKVKEGRSILSLAKEYNVKWSTMKNFLVVYMGMKKPPRRKAS